MSYSTCDTCGELRELKVTSEGASLCLLCWCRTMRGRRQINRLAGRKLCRVEAWEDAEMASYREVTEGGDKPLI